MLKLNESQRPVVMQFIKYMRMCSPERLWVVLVGLSRGEYKLGLCVYVVYVKMRWW